jgi:hypothetical protein
MSSSKETIRENILNEIIGLTIKYLVFCDSKDEALKGLNDIEAKTKEYRNIVENTGIYE